MASHPVPGGQCGTTGHNPQPKPSATSGLSGRLKLSHCKTIFHKTQNMAPTQSMIYDLSLAPSPDRLLHHVPAAARQSSEASEANLLPSNLQQQPQFRLRHSSPLSVHS